MSDPILFTGDWLAGTPVGGYRSLGGFTQPATITSIVITPTINTTADPNNYWSVEILHGWPGGSGTAPRWVAASATTQVTSWWVNQPFDLLAPVGLDDPMKIPMAAGEWLALAVTCVGSKLPTGLGNQAGWIGSLAIYGVWS